MHKNIWRQNSEKIEILGCSLQYIRFCDYMQIISDSGLTVEDMGFCSYVKAANQVGQQLDNDQKARFDNIIAKIPTMDLWSACFISPEINNGTELNNFMLTKTEPERETLRYFLNNLISITPKEIDMVYPIALSRLGIPLVKDLDYTTITLNQGMLLLMQMKKESDELNKVK